MDGVVAPFVRDAFTAEAFLALTLVVFGVASAGVFVVMWIRGDL
jgi:hypothetical protein